MLWLMFQAFIGKDVAYFAPNQAQLEKRFEQVLHYDAGMKASVAQKFLTDGFIKFNELNGSMRFINAGPSAGKYLRGRQFHLIWTDSFQVLENHKETIRPLLAANQGKLIVSI